MIRTALALLLCLLLVTGCTDDSDSAADQPPPVSQATATPSTNAAPASSLRPAPSGTATSTSQADLEPQPPRADPYDLARRYRGLDVNATPRTQPPAAQVGETRSFFVYDLDATRAMEVRATLLAQTEHADIWAQEGQRLSREDAERAGREFETKVYPQVTAAFGLPAPAADGSPGRIGILHAALRGAGGYFSGGDQVPRALAPYSNEQQIVYLDLTAARPGDDGYPGLLAHEFQHLVHQQVSPAADTWINEGLSEVADEMLGGGNAFLRRFETAADTQLNAWPPGESTAPHYGAAHSFLRYLLHQYGGLERAKDLSGQNAGGVNSVERYLRDGFNTGFLDVFADWTVANLLDEADGRYSQPGINHRVRGVEKLPAAGSGEATVDQFGADYLEVSPDGRDVTLRFDGDEQAPRVNVSPVSGRGLWWSNRADSMDSTLTRTVDLRSVSSATLRFRLWFSIERDYDYAYVAASRDGGRTWQMLAGQQTTDRDPLRIAYGPGYSGRSGGGEAAAWVEETIDLSQYAGEQILLRFEYVTDEATTADGLAIDDLSIPEIGWRDDAESDGGWQSGGFLRITEPLPQRFIVQLVETDANDANTVRRIALDGTNDAEITVPRTA
ncbi:MAG: hypothetical protein ACRDJ9_08565, partial [Dehalococcoidia bacterium]